jgi:hypothetical protein
MELVFDICIFLGIVLALVVLRWWFFGPPDDNDRSNAPWD